MNNKRIHELFEQAIEIGDHLKFRETAKYEEIKAYRKRMGINNTERDLPAEILKLSLEAIKNLLEENLKRNHKQICPKHPNTLESAFDRENLPNGYVNNQWQENRFRMILMCRTCYEERQKILSLPVDALIFKDSHIRVRVLNVFRADNLKTIRDVIQNTQGELRRCPDFGKVSLKQLKDALDNLGLKLKE